MSPDRVECHGLASQIGSDVIDGELVKQGTFWTFRTTCPLCGKSAEVRNLRKNAYEWWRRGAMVQDAFPELTADEREILVSGTHGRCFDAGFPEEETEATVRAWLFGE